MPLRRTAAGTEPPIQFHVLSFEGPDAYSRAGGLATRVEGLTNALAELGYESHLWFVGDPDAPGHEQRGRLHLHRWAQWISRHHPGGVYDGELGKHSEFARTVPPHLLREWLLPRLSSGGLAVILAEEWHTVDAVLHLHWLLERQRLRDRVSILWNANNVFGFESIDWKRLSKSARITTVSRYMRQIMQPLGVDATVIPNGLPGNAFDPPLLETLHDVDGADDVRLQSYVDPEARALLFRGAAAVLANSGREPFGLVGLEAMAAGGIGCTGEDYAVAGHNALVLETEDPAEFLGMYSPLRVRPGRARAMRRAGRATARRFAWPEVVDRVLLPRLGLMAGGEP